MSRTFQKLLALCLTAWMLWPTALAAADNVFAVIPHDVLGAAVIDNPGETQNQLTALAKQLKLPMPDLVALAQQRIGVSAGVDPHGSLAVAAVPTADGRGGPAWVGYVTTSDYQQLLKSLAAEPTDDRITKVTIGGRPSLMASKGGYAVIADAASQTALQHVLESQHSLADDMQALSPRVAQADVYAVAAPAGIKLAQTQLLAGLGTVKAQIEQQSPQASNVAAGLAIYETMFRALDKEFSHLMIGGQLEQDGALRVVMAAALIPNQTLAGLGKSEQPVAGDLFADIPPGPFVFGGGGIMPQGLAKSLMGWSMNMMKLYAGGAELSDADLKQLTETALESMGGVRAMSMVMGNAAPGAPLYENTTLVIKTDDARAYLATYEESIQRMSEILRKSAHPPFDYQASKISLEGHEVLEIRMDMSGMVEGQAVPQTQQMMALMFGQGGKLSIYMAAVDDQTVVGQYVSKERLLERLKSGPLKESLGQQPDVAKTLGMLPGTAQGLALWSPTGMFQMVRQMMQTLQPNGAFQLPDFPNSPPVGLAMEISPTRLDIDLVLPTELLQAIAQFAQSVRGAPPGQE